MQTTSDSLLDILLSSYMRLLFFEPFDTQHQGLDNHDFASTLFLLFDLCFHSSKRIFFSLWIFGQATLQRGVLWHTLATYVHWGLHFFYSCDFI